jgi:hypothetical protein
MPQKHVRAVESRFAPGVYGIVHGARRGLRVLARMIDTH